MNKLPTTLRSLVVFASLVLASWSVAAEKTSSKPTDPITEVVADPLKIQLRGAVERFQILINGKTALGDWVDLTREAKFESNNAEILHVSNHGVVQGRSDGSATVEIDAAGSHLRVEVSVSGTSRPRRFNFENDITPLLSRFGCNSSACHGKAEGQNGFKLSVFGYDPQADYRALAIESRGRRVSPAAPEHSLVLMKAAGTMPHGGGTRLRSGTAELETLRGWIAAGMPFGDPGDAKVDRIDITPSERVLPFDSHQSLRVLATYSNGSQTDVTHLAQFQSNNETIARVDEEGMVSVSEVPGQAAVMARYMGAVAIFQALIPRGAAIVDYPKLPVHNFIDALVDKKLQKLNILPSEMANDADFLRRVYLDVIGTLPTAKEARRFLADSRPERRQRLVDELLDRPEFADFWALKWSDLLRVDRQTLGQKDAYAYYKWIHDSLAANKPFDQIVREVVTAEGPLAESPQAFFYSVAKGPGDMASTLSQVFLGVRIACAECHHHPFDRWSQSDYFGMQAYFQPVSRKKGPLGEMLLVNGRPEATNPRTGQKVLPHPLGALTPNTAPDGDLRRFLADWLTSPENPWFARNLANRLVAHFLGRGLIEPVDDVRATNPPSNPELLDALGKFVGQTRFDLKDVMRLIIASRTYQLSSHPNETNLRDEQNYSRALFKRMSAEVLLDAVCQTTGVGEKFAGVPIGSRAIQLWDSDVSHYFLKLFGRPVRKTACECERNAEASIAQVLHLMNGPEIESKLNHEAGTVARLAATFREDKALIDEIYLTAFNRFPTDNERQTAEDFLRKAKNRRQGAEDLMWSMINSLEFIFNH